MTDTPGLQPSSTAAGGTAKLPLRRQSSSVSNLGSVGSETSKSSINLVQHAAAQSRITPEFQSGQPSGGSLGHHRRSRHQSAKNTVAEGILSGPKDAPIRRLPATTNRPPSSTLRSDLAPKMKFKPSTTSSITQPACVGSKAEPLPDHIIRLQMELMQLCVLHRDGIEAYRQWEQSAERKLQHRFDLLRKEHIRVKGLLQAEKTRKHQAALLSWSKKMTRAELATAIRSLSRNFTQTWQLTGPDGDCTRTVQTFRTWVERAMVVKGSREQMSGSTEQGIDFIEDIDNSWAPEVEALEQKLDSSLRELENIEEPPANTDFSHLVDSFKTLITSHLKELRLLREIHADVMAYEKTWIRSRVADFLEAVGPEIIPANEIETERGIWMRTS